MQTSGASARRRFLPLGGVLKIMAVTAGFGLAVERTDAADAGHSVAAKPAKEPVTVVAATDVETTSSIETKSPDDASCDISRKRLFVEGKGWIVRRVTTCY
jgi:stringent starvation protein B